MEGACAKHTACFQEADWSSFPRKYKCAPGSSYQSPSSDRQRVLHLFSVSRQGTPVSLIETGDQVMCFTSAPSNKGIPLNLSG